MEEARNSRVPKYSGEGGPRRWRWRARFRSSSKAGKDLPLLPPCFFPCSSQASQDASAKLQTRVKCRWWLGGVQRLLASTNAGCLPSSVAIAHEWSRKKFKMSSSSSSRSYSALVLLSFSSLATLEIRSASFHQPRSFNFLTRTGSNCRKQFRVSRERERERGLVYILPSFDKPRFLIFFLSSLLFFFTFYFLRSRCKHDEDRLAGRYHSGGGWPPSSACKGLALFSYSLPT